LFDHNDIALHGNQVGFLGMIVLGWVAVGAVRSIKSPLLIRLGVPTRVLCM
jgi:hypothetical protein